MQKTGLTMSCWIFSSTTCFISLPEPQPCSHSMLQTVEDGAGLFHRHGGIHPHTELLLDQVGHGDPGPGRGEVDGVVADLDDEVAVERVA